MMGIYKITNKETEEIYIGASNNVKRRISQHRSYNSANYSPKDMEGKCLIDRAIHEKGKDNFTYEIITTTDNENKLDELELYYILQYNSFANGYNYRIHGVSIDVGYTPGVGYSFTLIATDQINGRLGFKPGDIIKKIEIPDNK